MFDILYYGRRSVTDFDAKAYNKLTSKFWEAAKGLVRRRLQPLPVSTQILHQSITQKNPKNDLYSLSAGTTNRGMFVKAYETLVRQILSTNA
jgi:hypothetical protein